MKKFLSLSLLLLYVVVALAVTPVNADSKIFEMRLNREPFFGTITIDDVDYDLVGYNHAHMISWEREAGGYRSIFDTTIVAKLYYEGEVVGAGVGHTFTEAVSPDGMQDIVSLMKVVITLHGSGEVVNYFLVVIVRNGQVVTTHEIGTPPP